ncbi:alpha/beta hydrolase [Streptomyces sp. KMM 9044]|uniref:alpha/beta hydrolase n=1 Tax=Streptomyces sp. KMM 9044 TaxID=2744474 RepID=UPI0021506D93|nr:alpha/beta hydrolase [Streptomyces sp. KMM 9044]WAX79396.1 alpha/beta hydrolase [Streptomyces sp. KMM 9044]
MSRTVTRIPLTRAAGAAAGALVLLLGAAGPTAAGGPGGGGGGDVVLRWQDCRDVTQTGFECAVANVPLDHARPGGRTIGLAVIRHRATAPGKRVGTLFFNPGGPGGPGTVGLPGLYDKFPDELRDRYDIVSWDPRGVGRSTAVRCFGTAGEAADWQADLPPFPVGEQAQQAYVAAYADLAERCAQSDPQLLRRVSTADTARDLDLLRAAVGEERLHYWGVSYGTLLGATYANLFPERAGRLLLDGNVDPLAWVGQADAVSAAAAVDKTAGKAGAVSEAGPSAGLNTFLRLGSHLGSADTLAQFLDHCGRAPVTGCVFSAGSPAATRDKYDTLMARLARRPAGDPTFARAVSEVRGGLYTVHPGWAGVADLLQTLWSGRPLVPLSDPAGPARYPGFEQPLAVLCAESPNPRSPLLYPGLEERAVAQAGALARWWVWANEPCATWPARAAAPYTGPWDGATAHPVLVVNTAHDPSTPYAAGVSTARELRNARLLTVDGYGHTALDNPSACVGRHAVRYFLTGALPPEGARCTQDLPPFVERIPGTPSGRDPEAAPEPAAAGAPSGLLPPAGDADAALPYGRWPLDVVAGLLPAGDRRTAP